MSYKLTNLEKPIRNLAGVEIIDQSGFPLFVGKVIANVLASANSPDPVGVMLLAQKIYRAGNEVLIDDAEYGTVKDTINRSNTMMNVARAECLRVINEAEKVEEKDEQK